MFSRTMMPTTVGIAGTAGSMAWAGGEAPGALQGRWIAVRAERDARTAAEIVGRFLVIDGSHFCIEENGATIYEGTLEFDTDASPWVIDFKHTGGSLDGRTWRGIFQFDGETLTICDNAADLRKARPASFVTGLDSGRVLVVLERARP
jgi:uncharacterized protein (TIGR03067 family)